MNQERCPTCQRSYTKNRSNNQNRYMWGVVYETLSNHLGYTPEEIHEICKHKFLKGWLTLHEKSGAKEIEITKSTASLNTVEMENYLTKIREWASIELTCWIPDPNEVYS